MDGLGALSLTAARIVREVHFALKRGPIRRDAIVAHYRREDYGRTPDREIEIALRYLDAMEDVEVKDCECVYSRVALPGDL